MITIIVWNGVLYEYANPQDVFGGVFTFRSIHGSEHNIDLRGYLSSRRYAGRKIA